MEFQARGQKWNIKSADGSIGHYSWVTRERLRWTRQNSERFLRAIVLKARHDIEKLSFRLVVVPMTTC